MPDVEKVIKGLEQFIADFKPFCGNKSDWKRVDDALALLKAQEPMDAVPVEWLKKVRKDASEGDSLDVGIAEVLDMWEKEQEAR